MQRGKGNILIWELQKTKKKTKKKQNKTKQKMELKALGVVKIERRKGETFNRK
jgi:hypothetical protein